jgi:hypothetical protein
MQNIDWGKVIETLITILTVVGGIIGSHKSLSKKIDNLKK